MNVDSWLRGIAGLFVFASVALGYAHSPLQGSILSNILTWGSLRFQRCSPQANIFSPLRGSESIFSQDRSDAVRCNGIRCIS